MCHAPSSFLVGRLLWAEPLLSEHPRRRHGTALCLADKSRLARSHEEIAARTDQRRGTRGTPGLAAVRLHDLHIG